MKLKQARKNASASFATSVALGELIMAEENQHYLDDTALPLVAASLKGRNELTVMNLIEGMKGLPAISDGDSQLVRTT